MSLRYVTPGKYSRRLARMLPGGGERFSECPAAGKVLADFVRVAQIEPQCPTEPTDKV